MSKIFEALNSRQPKLVNQVEKVPASRQKPPSPELETSWKEQYYPRFTEYKIDQFLDYLLSLHRLGTTATYGIVPVSRSDSTAEIVLETFMHLCANRDGRKLLTDLSTNKLMLQQLLDFHAFDQPYLPDRIGPVASVLHSLFYFVAKAEEPAPSQRSYNTQFPELDKLAEIYDVSLFLFPEVSKFNINNVQLLRQLDNLILLCPENGNQELAKTGRFLDKLGVKMNGVYLFD